MKIKFGNGSVLESIPSKINPVRSKRGEQQIDYWMEYWRKHPEAFIEEIMDVKLSWWQKLLIQLKNTRKKVFK